MARSRFDPTTEHYMKILGLDAMSLGLSPSGSPQSRRSSAPTDLAPSTLAKIVTERPIEPVMSLSDRPTRSLNDTVKALVPTNPNLPTGTDWMTPAQNPNRPVYPVSNRYPISNRPTRSIAETAGLMVPSGIPQGTPNPQTKKQQPFMNKTGMIAMLVAEMFNRGPGATPIQRFIGGYNARIAAQTKSDYQTMMLGMREDALAVTKTTAESASNARAEAQKARIFGLWNDIRQKTEERADRYEGEELDRLTGIRRDKGEQLTDEDKIGVLTKKNEIISSIPSYASIESEFNSGVDYATTYIKNRTGISGTQSQVQKVAPQTGSAGVSEPDGTTPSKVTDNQTPPPEPPPTDGVTGATPTVGVTVAPSQSKPTNRVIKPNPTAGKSSTTPKRIPMTVPKSIDKTGKTLRGIGEVVDIFSKEVTAYGNVLEINEKIANLEPTKKKVYAESARAIAEAARANIALTVEKKYSMLTAEQKGQYNHNLLIIQHKKIELAPLEKDLLREQIRNTKARTNSIVSGKLGTKLSEATKRANALSDSGMDTWEAVAWERNVQGVIGKNTPQDMKHYMKNGTISYTNEFATREDMEYWAKRNPIFRFSPTATPAMKAEFGAHMKKLRNNQAVEQSKPVKTTPVNTSPARTIRPKTTGGGVRPELKALLGRRK